MKRPLSALVAVLLIVGGTVAGFSTTLGNAQTAAASCTEPTAPDRDATEQYAACRAAEVAAVLSSLPPVPTVTATEMATETVTATATATSTVTVTASPTPTPTPTPTEDPAALKVIGMSSPASLWDQRLAEVGPQGVRARRIFADLTSTGISQRSLIQDAIDAGMTPVVSVKFPSVSTGAAGGYNAWAATAADQLQAFGVHILIAIWHEPFDDMTASQYLAIQRQMLPIFNARSNLETYCILHAWLLDNRMSDFAAYTAPDVMAMLDDFGVDSYQSGTNTSPGSKDLSTRMSTLLDWLADQGVPDKPLVIGEWSAYTNASLQRVGETILSTPNVAYALLFNSNTGSKGEPLVPGTDRMATFKATKSDPRAAQ